MTTTSGASGRWGSTSGDLDPNGPIGGPGGADRADQRALLNAGGGSGGLPGCSLSAHPSGRPLATPKGQARPPSAPAGCARGAGCGRVRPGASEPRPAQSPRGRKRPGGTGARARCWSPSLPLALALALALSLSRSLARARARALCLALPLPPAPDRVTAAGMAVAPAPPGWRRRALAPAPPRWWLAVASLVARRARVALPRARPAGAGRLAQSDRQRQFGDVESW
eukprot:scaffold4189_cov378-Prasinococcus_capsulatus_cf.AAC.17